MHWCLGHMIYDLKSKENQNRKNANQDRNKNTDEKKLKGKWRCTGV